MTVLRTTDLRSLVAQQRLFIACIKREEVSDSDGKTWSVEV